MGDRPLAEELRSRGIRDERVLAAIASLSRAQFLPPSQTADPLGDHPLPIGFGQTISQPYIVAYMSEALAIQEGDKVLEIGTGSGYQAAVLAQLGAHVYSMEIVPELALHAREVITRLGLPNIALRLGDGAEGWPEAAPFDAIVLTAAPQRVPERLLAQLAEGGRLLAPVGEVEGVQRLIRVTRGGGSFHVERLLAVRFVPMTGAVREGDPQLPH